MAHLPATSSALLALSLLAGCQATRTHYPPPDASLPFSSAVRVGDTLYVAGHLGTDAETGRAPDDPAAEAERLLDRFEETLARAGMTMDDLVMVEVHCSDVQLYDVFNNAYRARFERGYPARAFLGAGTLLRGCRFEMLGTAVAR